MVKNRKRFHGANHRLTSHYVTFAVQKCNAGHELEVQYQGMISVDSANSLKIKSSICVQRLIYSQSFTKIQCHKNPVTC